MFKLFFLCSLAALIQGRGIPHGSINDYVVGGRNASISEIPYIVSMQRNSRHSCGGSILTPTIILTAAHCIQNTQPDSIVFRAGSSDVKTSGTIVKVKAIHGHPKFTMATLDYDVAIIELKTPLNFSDTIKPISLTDSEPLRGVFSRTSGWGLLREGGEAPRFLQTVVVPMVSRGICVENYKKEIPITMRMICAGVVGKDSCQGDSGGPLVQGGRLAGVVSFGTGCARKNFPGVYTNIANAEIMSFIKEFVNKTSS